MATSNLNSFLPIDNFIPTGSERTPAPDGDPRSFLPIDNFIQPQQTELDDGPVTGSFTGGLGVGTFGGIAAVGGALQAVGERSGSQKLIDFGSSIQSYGEEELESYRPRVTRLEQIQSPGDALDFILFGAGSAIPSIAATVGAGAVGAVAGGPLGAASAGSLTGAGVMSYLLNAGDVYLNLKEQGTPDAAAALKAGIPMAMLDVITPVRIAGKVGFRVSDKFLRGEVPDSFLKRTVKEAGVISATEAATEAGQQLIQSGTVNAVGDRPLLTPEVAADVLNAAAIGAIGGAGPGAIAGAFGRRPEQAPPPPPPPFVPAGLLPPPPLQLPPPPIYAYGPGGAQSGPVINLPGPEGGPTEPPAPPVPPTGPTTVVPEGAPEPNPGPTVPGFYTTPTGPTQILPPTRLAVAPVPTTPEGLQPETAQVQNVVGLNHSLTPNTIPITDIPLSALPRLMTEAWQQTKEYFGAKGLALGFKTGDRYIATMNALPSSVRTPEFWRNLVNKFENLGVPSKALGQGSFYGDFSPTDLAQVAAELSTPIPESNEGIYTALNNILSHSANNLMRGNASYAYLQVRAKMLFEALYDRGVLFDEMATKITAVDKQFLGRIAFRLTAEKGATTPVYDDGSYTPITGDVLDLLEQRNNLRNKIATKVSIPLSRSSLKLLRGELGIQHGDPTLSHPSSRTKDKSYLFQGLEGETVIASTDPTIVGKQFDRAFVQSGEVHIIDPDMTPATARLIAKTYKRWLNKYIPGGTIVVVGSKHATTVGVDQGNYGTHIAVSPGVSIIHLNLKNHSTPQHFASTVAHEFGHSILSHRMWTMPKEVRQGVENEWRKWIKSAHKMTMNDFMSRLRLPLLPLRFKIDSKDGDLLVPDYLKQHPERKDYFAYYVSFTEFMAESFVQRTFMREDWPTAVRKFFSKLIQDLRSFFSYSKILGRPGNSFDAWLEMLATESEIRRKIEGERETYDTATYQSDLADAQYVEPMLRDVESDAQGSMRESGMEDVAPTKEDVAEVRTDLDRFGYLQKVLLTLLQVAQQNPHVAGLQKYMSAVRKWHSAKGEYLTRADSRLKALNAFPRKTRDAVWRVMMRMSFDSEDLGRKLTDSEIATLAQEEGIKDADVLAEIFAMRDDFASVIEAMEKLELEKAGSTFAEVTPEFVAALQKAIREKYARLKTTDYFPYMRFGRYTVVAKATEAFEKDGRKYKKGETVHFEAHEREGLQKKAAKLVEQDFKDDPVTVATRLLTDEEYAFLGFSPTLMQSLASNLLLTPQQRHTLEELAVRWSPGESFRKRMLRRKGVAGMSTDGARVYANYFLHAANHLARLRYADEMRSGLLDVRQSAAQAANQGRDTVKRDLMHSYMAEHFNFIMKPENDLAGIRSFLFTMFLGFNVKSAVVNLSQVPMVTLPWMSTRYGWAESARALARASRDASIAIKNPEHLSVEEQAAIERAVKEQFIDESMAQELASLSDGNVLGRIAPQTAAGRAIRDVGYYGAFMFRATEKFNRRITFLAAYRLAKAQGQSEEQAFVAGRDAVDNTQYEYARWNRPELMRGKKSVLFVFQQYVQHTLFLVYNDPSRMRFLFSLLAFGGLLGLPGAEDLLDVIDLFGTEVRKWLGLGDKVDTRNWLRRQMKETMGLTAGQSDLLLHGVSRESFGLATVANAAGVPFPSIDFSSSITLGRTPIVGDVIQAFDSTGDFSASRATGALGPGINFVQGVLDAWNSDNPERFKRWERAFPSALKGVARAYETVSRGALTDSRGDVLFNFDPNDPEHWGNATSMLLGGTPTEVSRTRELRWAQREAVQYYETARTRLMMQYYWARRWGDTDLAKTVMESIQKYNSTVPDRNLAITRKDLSVSTRRRLKNQQAREANVSPEKKYRGVYRDIAEIYQ